MNKKLSFIALSALMLTACSNDDLSPIAGLGEPTDVTFTIGLPDGLQTRTENTTVGKGYSVERLYVTAISKADATKRVTKKIDDAFAGNATTANVTLNLVKGDTYNIVFWADAGTGSPYTYNPATGEVSLNYTGLSTNDEKQDAFTKYLPSFTAGDTAPEPVLLNRPFAQVNIACTTDDTDAASALGINVTKTAVNIAFDAYPTLNLISGEMTGTPTTYTVATPLAYAKTAKPSDQLMVNGTAYDYLACFYVLAGENGNVLTNVNFQFDSNTGNRDYSNIPVKRNHRTNIIGQILTNPYNFEVVLDEAFTQPDENYEIVFTSPIVPDVVVEAGANAQQELTDLCESIDNGEELIIGLPEGEFTLPSTLKGDVTLVGQAPVAGVYPTVVTMKNEVKTAQHVSFASIKMVRGTESYKGFQHTVSESYTDCEITGTLITYAGTVEFKNCTFTSPTDKYVVQVYGAPATALFENCEFHTDRKAILVYNENNKVLDVTVNNCKFYRDIPTTKEIDKCAISCHTEQGTQGTLTINNSTATGFAPFNGGLWRDVNNTTDKPSNNFLVTVDGKVIAAKDKE